MLDYQPSERKDYIESFFENIDWKTVERRLTQTVAPTSTSPWS
ncbi:MAG: hypothetical protein KF693_00585 [Nitrospira sp.]|nr:hypothetical protein [Nitrospira sp.]